MLGKSRFTTHSKYNIQCCWAMRHVHSMPGAWTGTAGRWKLAQGTCSRSNKTHPSLGPFFHWRCPTAPGARHPLSCAPHTLNPQAIRPTACCQTSEGHAAQHPPTLNGLVAAAAALEGGAGSSSLSSSSSSSSSVAKPAGCMHTHSQKTRSHKPTWQVMNSLAAPGCTLCSQCLANKHTCTASQEVQQTGGALPHLPAHPRLHPPPRPLQANVHMVVCVSPQDDTVSMLGSLLLLPCHVQCWTGACTVG